MEAWATHLWVEMMRNHIEGAGILETPAETQTGLLADLPWLARTTQPVHLFSELRVST